MTPPRLLAGISLLFWGGMTGHAILGLIAALMLEARSWISLRWNFSPTTYVRSWHYSVLCGALIAVLAWMNGMKTGKLHTLFVWAPLALLPIELAMRYGKASSIPLNTFSFFARKKMMRDIEHGRAVEPRMINTGYAYLAVVLLATAMGSDNNLYHMIGLNLIIVSALFANAKKAGLRPWAWVVSILMVIALSLGAQWGMFKLYDYYRGAGNYEGKNQRISANETRTSIGKLGKLKLSPRIFWRMEVTEGNVPKLLRVATYNQYNNATWKYNPGRIPNDSQRGEDGYLGEENIGEYDIRIFRENDPTPPPAFPEQANVIIIGEIDASIQENPVPMPHFTQAVGGIGNLGDLASLDCNTLGTIRLANPDFNVIEYRIWTGDDSYTEIPRQTAYDLSIPPRELPAIQRVSKNLGLDQLQSTQQKIQRLRQFFNREFAYSTHLHTPRLSKNQRQTAVGSFLETTRTGHCEYFATATTLLLREAGVPTRYCVGFSVSEYDKDHGEWLMRGQHAHAWCRVWIDDTNSPNGGHWQDLDLTPAAWQNMDTGDKALWQQRLADWWQRIKEDFLIWRTHKSNKSWVVTLVTVAITLLTLWIIWRLWKSRQRNKPHRARRYQPPASAVITPLNRLEPKLARILGPRPVGMPMVTWVQRLHELDPTLTPLLDEISRLYSRMRFDQDNLSTEDERSITELCRQLSPALKKIRKNS